MKVSLSLVEESLPRTIYWQHFREALQRNPRFTVDAAEADLLFPAEDIALETNWPRYGNMASAFIRGNAFDQPLLMDYLRRVAAERGPFCVVSMFPSMRLAWAFLQCPQVVVADVSMSAWERALNPRTVSMPTLPITLPPEGQAPVPRDILASFRGAPSHPCREVLARLHDGRRIVIELVPVTQHAGRIDATTATVDGGYVDVMRRSVFAFVPRGDSLFSYRLAEAMAFGCIPVVISDGWLMPFDRQIAWPSVAVTVPENLVPHMGEILSKFTPERIAHLQTEGAQIYKRFLSNIDVVVDSLLREVELTFFGQRAAI